MNTDRHIRFFVSSTFRDMMAERDYLAKTVFPQLRKICESRGVTWGEVDLRWGIPDEDRDDLIPLCLEEIRRCRPYFLCILGERYGHVPDEIPADSIKRYPWLAQHCRKSITELEILFGCLADGLPMQQAFFYFRDPAYLDCLPPGSRRVDYISPTPEAHEQLEGLKLKIRTAAHLGICILRENFHSTEELGEWILRDLTGLINRQYPVAESLDPLRQETEAHLGFARKLTRFYIQRPEAFARLDTHIAGSGPPLVVVGEAGAGKSTLLAKWYLQRAKHLDGTCLIHFAGCTPASTNPTIILRRVMLELKGRMATTENPLPSDIPLDAHAVRRDFPRWLNRAASATPLVLMLDGIDQIEGPEASELGWLPDQYPPNCRIILATPPGPWLEAARRRGWHEQSLAPMTLEQRVELLQQYLAQYGRRLSLRDIEHITCAEQAGCPLFLCALLEELRLFGEHERLGKRITHYLSARTTIELFKLILQRLELDYGPDQQLVRRSLSLIACAHRGLSEAELLELLGRPGEPIPFRTWAPLSLAIEHHMINKSGLLRFATGPLRQAVEQSYLPKSEDKSQVHCRLAKYFDFLPLPARVKGYGSEAMQISFSHTEPVLYRVLDELPWQQAQAGDWNGLLSTLTLLPLFEAAYGAGRDLEWISYWQMLRQAEAAGQVNNVNIAERYLHEFRQLEETKRLVLAAALGQFLLACGYPEAAAECLSYENERLSGQVPVFLWAANLNDQARILADQEKLEEALIYYEKAELLLRANRDAPENRRCLASVLINRANLMVKLGVLAGARERLDEALGLMKESTGEDSSEVATVLQCLGNCYIAKGDLKKAESLHQQAYELRLRRLGPRHRDVGLSLYNLGTVLARQGKIFYAAQYLERAVDIFQETLGLEHTYTRSAITNLKKLRALEP